MVAIEGDLQRLKADVWEEMTRRRQPREGFRKLMKKGVRLVGTSEVRGEEGNMELKVGWWDATARMLVWHLPSDLVVV
jgi:hypothetical protein